MMTAPLSTSTISSLIDDQMLKRAQSTMHASDISSTNVDSNDDAWDISSTNTSTDNMGWGSELDSRFSDDSCSTGSSSYTDDSEDEGWEIFLEHSKNSFEDQVPLENLAIRPAVPKGMRAWHLECLAKSICCKNTLPFPSLNNSGRNAGVDKRKILISL